MRLLFAVLLLGHWLLVSDLHVEPGAGDPMPSHFTEDTNWALFDSTVATMRQADPNPQVVIVSGDLLAHRFPNNAALAESTMAHIAKTFNAAFPHAQFLIVPGNNDDPCGDYRVTPGSPYFANLARIWAPLVNRHGAAPTFVRDFSQYGWYTARTPIRSVQLVALDTVYYSIVYRRCGNYHPDAPARQLQWLSRTLGSLPAKNRAIVVMHIPPGVDAKTTLETHRLLVVPFMQQQAAASLTRIFSAHADRVAFAVAGHVHRDAFRVFGRVPILIAPSISPVYDNNPAFLRLDVDSAGTLRDYTPFFYDEFSEAWERGASFDTAFHVNGFNTGSLLAIHKRLHGDANLRAVWAGRYASQGRSDIDAGRWLSYWCAQTQLAGSFAACAGFQYRAAVFPIAAGLAGAGVIALLALFAVRLGRQRRKA